MSIYVSSACLNGYPNFVELVRHLCEFGIRYIEDGAGSKPGPNFIEQLHAYPCNYLVHNYFPPPTEPFVLNLASADPMIQQRSLDLVRQAIDLSAEFDAPFYSVHAGFITDPYAFSNGHFQFPDATEPDAPQRAFDRFVSALLTADQYAREHRVKLLVENNVCWPDLRGKLLVQTADEILKLFDTLGSDNVGVLLDFGHLNVFAHTLDFNRLDFIERVAAHIHAFHVHDNDGTADAHRPAGSTSWVLDVLRRPEFAELRVIVEAQFTSVVELIKYVDWLSAYLANTTESISL